MDGRIVESCCALALRLRGTPPHLLPRPAPAAAVDRTAAAFPWHTFPFLFTASGGMLESSKPSLGVRDPGQGVSGGFRGVPWFRSSPARLRPLPPFHHHIITSSSSASGCGSLSRGVFPEGEQRGRVRRASGGGRADARRQGFLGRRSSPGTWRFPRSPPPRAPLAPLVLPPESLQRAPRAEDGFDAGRGEAGRRGRREPGHARRPARKRRAGAGARRRPRRRPRPRRPRRGAPPLRPAPPSGRVGAPPTNPTQPPPPPPPVGLGDVWPPRPAPGHPSGAPALRRRPAPGRSLIR